MKALITPLLISYLQGQGYKFCLARKLDAAVKSRDKCLILLPLKKRPKTGSLPDLYYTVLKMNEEPAVVALDPVLLADDPDGETLVMMELSSTDLGGYLNFLFDTQSKSA